MSGDTDDRPISPARKTDEEYLAELARQHAEGLSAGEALTEHETRPLEGEFVRAEPEELAQTLNSMVPDQAEAEAREVEAAPEEPPPLADATPIANKEAEPIADEPAAPPAAPAEDQQAQPSLGPPPVQAAPAEEPQGEPAAEESPPAPPPVTDEEAEPVVEEQPAAAPLPAPIEALNPQQVIRGRRAPPDPLLRLLLQVLAVAALIALAVALHLMTR